jgi:hypothetical protein
MPAESVGMAGGEGSDARSELGETRLAHPTIHRVQDGINIMAITGNFVLKLNRARHHLDDLNSEITTWSKSNHYRISKQRDPNRPEYLDIFAVVEKVPLDPISLLIGDVLHNLSGALDHLAYALAEANPANAKPLAKEIAEHSEFPIIGDINSKRIAGAGQRMFDEAKRKKLRGITPEAQAVIEELQPYQRGNKFTSDPLWTLYELSNIDKHRLLLVGTCFCEGTIVHGEFADQPWAQGRNIRVYGGFVDVKTKIASIAVTPEREKDVEVTPMMDIFFKCGCTVDAKSVIATLKGIFNHIAIVVIQRLAKFL